MTKYILDIETSVRFDEKGKYKSSPYDTACKLVTVCVKNVDTQEVELLVFNHADWEFDSNYWGVPKERLQAMLDSATLIIGHNLKFDMSWLYECGFKYDGALYDTMLFEYIAAKGLKPGLSLADCAERYKLDPKKDILKEYLNAGVNTDLMPLAELSEYAIQDIETTYQLYQHQRARYAAEEEIRKMWSALKLTNETLEVLIDIERNGIKIDIAALDAVEKEYREEKAQLEVKLNEMVRGVMGDTPINLASPNDMTKVVYSLEVTDKKKWAELFNIGQEIVDGMAKKKYVRRYKEEVFRDVVRKNTTKTYRTDAKHCEACDGRGVIQKYKKDKVAKKTGIITPGEPHKKPNKCKACNGAKVLYIPNDRIAGFKVRPIDSEYATSSGFSTDKTTIDDLVDTGKLSPDAEVFLRSLQRLNAIDTYLSAFVDGIRNSISSDGYCHPNFNQGVTRTGRLSSSGPNWQNQPRGGTFPIRRCVVSRFAGGKLLPTDGAALEYRVAVLNAKCPAGLDSILNGKDRHQLSAEILFGISKEDMEPDEWKDYRQKAKAGCVPMHSQALTRTGWKHYDELVIGEDILAYDQETNTNQWTPLLDKGIYGVEKVFTMSHEHNFSVESTDNHRWYGQKRNWRGGYDSTVFMTESYTTNHRITTSAPTISVGTMDITPSEAALFGWLWTDGSVSASPLTGITSQAGGRRQAIRGVIIQKKDKGIQHIRKVLADIGMNYKERVKPIDCLVFHLPSPALRTLYKKAGLDLVTPDKVGFVLSLSPECRKEFLHACILAEGSVRDYGQHRLTQNVGDMKEAMQLAAYLEGYDVRVSITKKEKVKLANFDHAALALRTRPYVNCTRLVKKYKGEEEVWCPNTKFDTWVMRQGETITITGNTFQPLFAGKGQTDQSQAYAEAFFEEHYGIRKWHEELGAEALDTKQIVSISGRHFAFPYTKRNEKGRVSGMTKIANYPVQSFTADLMWSIIIPLWREMKTLGLKSKLILQVHDDVVPDVPPEEVDIMIELLKKHFDNVWGYLTERFNYVTNVPIGYEISIGDNLMDKKTIFERK